MGRSSLRGRKLSIAGSAEESRGAGTGRRRSRDRGQERPARVGETAFGPVPEFSRPVLVETVMVQGGVTLELEAGPAERQALASRFALEALDRLTATVSLTTTDRGRMIRVRGRFAAEVVQLCVVTLEPFSAQVTEPFSALFTLDADAVGGDFLFDSAALDEEDLPEPVEGGRIDVGELVAQHLSLALDPHPRRPGAELPPGNPWQESGEDDGEQNHD